MTFSKFFRLSIIIIMILSFVGCWNPFNPKEEEDISPEDIPYLAPTTPDNVLKNLILSYRYHDIDMYLECLSQDEAHPFEFHLLEQDWQDLNHDGLTDRYWGLETEERFTRNMFQKAKDIQIDDFRGTSQYPDSHDENQVILKRQFNLMVMLDDNLGMKAHGEAKFTMRKNEETGKWYIVKWVDESKVY